MQRNDVATCLGCLGRWSSWCSIVDTGADFLFSRGSGGGSGAFLALFATDAESTFEAGYEATTALLLLLRGGFHFLFGA